MKKVLIITGLTASGKSGLALEIAQKYNGEIISCDSVQVYKGLDIGSAKVSKMEQKKTKHHLIDIVEPTHNYNVSEFMTDCIQAINDCISRNKLPILVGGTGMYIKSIMEGYTLGIESNIEFRKHWEEEAEKRGKEYVWNELYKINPEMANSVHVNNLKRVIRYLEISTNTNTKKLIKDSPLKDFDVLAVGINIDKELIYPKIESRVDQMLDDGLEKEVKGLISKGLDLSYNSMNTIGYREMFEYLTNVIDYKKCVDLIKQHTRNYAKRQLTFMKTINNLKIVQIEETKQIIEQWLKEENKNGL